MYQFECKEVLRVLGINNPLTTTRISTDYDVPVHYWENLAIYYGGNGYAIIRGKIPFEVVNTIYQKYPNNPYNIRIDGGCIDYKPREFVVDDRYKKECEEISHSKLELREEKAKYFKARKNMLRRNNENKYIEVYHIDTKEGLVIFILEMKDYLARKQGLKETEVQRFDELMTTINFEIIKKINPTISTYEWMEGDKNNKDLFFQTLQREKRRFLGKEFRKMLDEFDKTVNPCLNERIDLEAANNYLKKINISGFTYDDRMYQERKNRCYLQIANVRCFNDLTSYSTVSFDRDTTGFRYYLGYCFNKEYWHTVTHYFGNDGEIVLLHYFGNNCPEKVDLRYDLTDNVLINYNGNRGKITAVEKKYIYGELVKAIGLASSITIDNMKKKDNVKKLIKK